MSSLKTRPIDVEFRDLETQVLLVGDWRQREFATASAAIREAQTWPTVCNIEEAHAALTTDEQPPELILLAQPLPGMFRQSDIDRLQQLSPLTRLVIVAGSWCEGELRTGNPPHGVIRLYWYELQSWWRAAKLRCDAGLCPLWSQSLQRPQDGRWSAEPPELTTQNSTRDVLINCVDFAAYETLASGLREYGCQTRWSRNKPSVAPQSAEAGIWDGGQLGRSELNDLAEFCQRVDGPVVALLDFPRVEHLEHAQGAGASHVLAKPYVVEELAMALRGN